MVLHPVKRNISQSRAGVFKHHIDERLLRPNSGPFNNKVLIIYYLWRNAAVTLKVSPNGARTFSAVASDGLPRPASVSRKKRSDTPVSLARSGTVSRSFFRISLMASFSDIEVAESSS